MGSRSRAREQALQILYFVDLTGTPAADALPLFRENFDSPEDDFPFAEQLVSGIQTNQATLDKALEDSSDNWKLSRMSRIDRNILRLGAFELLHCPETPSSVAIDEAIELAKKYGDEHSPSFVNGILDRISRESRKGI